MSSLGCHRAPGRSRHRLGPIRVIRVREDGAPRIYHLRVDHRDGISPALTSEIRERQERASVSGPAGPGRGVFSKRCPCGLHLVAELLAGRRRLGLRAEDKAHIAAVPRQAAPSQRGVEHVAPRSCIGERQPMFSYTLSLPLFTYVCQGPRSCRCRTWSCKRTGSRNAAASRRLHRFESANCYPPHKRE